MKNILFAYYTRTNTTKEICEHIANRILADHLNINILPIESITDISHFDVVIAATPIHGMRLSQEMQTFIEEHHDTLEKTNFAIFYDSYLLDNGRKMWQKAIHRSLNNVKETLNPIAVGEFYGRVDSVFGTIPQLIFGNRKDESLDRRNWSAIDKFADELLLKINE